MEELGTFQTDNIFFILVFTIKFKKKFIPISVGYDLGKL